MTALSGVDLDVAPGEFVSLIGPSGCGKSTLLRLVADLDQPTSGTLEVFGKTARQARLDQDYGIAFQQAGLLPWRTVARNIELPLALHKVGKAGTRGPGRRAGRADRSDRLRRVLPRPAVRRHAAARRHRPRPGRASPAAADGRAVRRAGRDDPRAHAERARPDLRRDRRRGRLRHALDPRGRVPVRPRRRHVARDRAGSSTSCPSGCPAPTRDDALREDAAFFEAVAAGARGAARRHRRAAPAGWRPGERHVGGRAGRGRHRPCGSTDRPQPASSPPAGRCGPSSRRSSSAWCSSGSGSCWSSALHIDPYVVPAPSGDPGRARGQPRTRSPRAPRTPGSTPCSGLVIGTARRRRGRGAGQRRPDPRPAGRAASSPRCR